MDKLTPENLNRTRQTQQPCYVSDKCSDDNRRNVNKSVCRDLATTNHTDDKHYCLLHLPTKDKDIEKFEQLFQTRLHEHDEAIAMIEAEFPNDKDKQNEAKHKQSIKYDYRYVWFPSSVDLTHHNFKANADFRSATFSADAYFMSANFSANADFRSATFSADADFRSANFSAYADFSSATFSASAYFSSATFSADAYFSSATFSAHADFISATFSADAYFSSATFSAVASFMSAKFLETSQIYFEETRFCSDVNFYQTEFDGYVEFSGDVFLDADAVQKVKTETNNEWIKDGQEAFLKLEKARFNKPERISLNSMKLRPSWFVGTDVRNVNFNDVEWLNLEIDVDRNGLNTEFDNLTNREVSQPRESLIKAFNQLGDNAEANRRFEEAKQFRKQSIALKKYNCYVADGLTETDKDGIRLTVCQGYPVVNEDGGQYYCLWHNPDKNKAEVFLKEFEKCKENNHADYRYVVFPIDVWFFWEQPKALDFQGAKFQRKLTFAEAKIHYLNLSETKFEKDAELNFSYSTCDDQILLDKSIFDGRLNLYGQIDYIFFTKDGSLSMKEARFDKPNWIYFRNVQLLAEYFFEVDSSRFTFHDCKWIDDKENYVPLDKDKNYQVHKMYAQTCNHLAINYEENRHFEESSMFRYASMESKRLSFIKSVKKDWFNRFNRLLYWIYKWTSGYGESWSWAMGLLVGILIGFGVLFSLPISTFDYGEKKMESSNDVIEQAINGIDNHSKRFRSMTLPDGIVHSLSVATFQRPEPKADGFWTKLFVVLEVIFAPLQAALLALAIRRKFMR